MLSVQVKLLNALFTTCCSIESLKCGQHCSGSLTCVRVDNKCKALTNLTCGSFAFTFWNCTRSIVLLYNCSFPIYSWTAPRYLYCLSIWGQFVMHIYSAFIAAASCCWLHLKHVESISVWWFIFLLNWDANLSLVKCCNWCCILLLCVWRQSILLM